MNDLFSETQIRPTPAMRAAMAAADVGDEQLGEDPIWLRLTTHLDITAGIALRDAEAIVRITASLGDDGGRREA